MKVLFAADGSKSSSNSNVWLLELLLQLKQKNFTPSVLFSAEQAEPCEVAEQFKSQGISSTTYISSSTEISVSEILDYLREDPPDVFVPNSNVPCYFAAPWIKASGIPTVGIIRANDDFDRDIIEEFVCGSPKFKLSGVVCASEALARGVLEKAPDFPVLSCPSETSEQSEGAQWKCSETCAGLWAQFFLQLVSSAGPRKKISAPKLDKLELPAVRTSQQGISTQERRLYQNTSSSVQTMSKPQDSSPASTPQIDPNQEKIAKEFLNPELSKENIDRYLVRSAVLKAVQNAIHHFSGTFLDVGCGIMPYRSLITSPPSRVEQYIGLDIESEYYEANVTLRWDGKKIPLEDNSVDCAMATEVLEHCDEPLSILNEISRVIKSGGVFFFTVPYVWPLHDIPYDYYRYTSFGLKNLFEKSGFGRCQIEALGGWNASVAQMIGLWIRRAPLDPTTRSNMENQLFPLYQSLVESDSLPDPFGINTMATGWTGLAYK